MSLFLKIDKGLHMTREYVSVYTWVLENFEVSRRFCFTKEKGIFVLLVKFVKV